MTYTLFEPVSLRIQHVNVNGEFYKVIYNIGQDDNGDAVTTELKFFRNTTNDVVKAIASEDEHRNEMNIKSTVGSGEDGADASETTDGKAAAGQPCNSKEEKKGCIDGYRCSVADGAGICASQADCDDSEKKLTCGAKTLAATALAALAIASSM